MAFYVQLPDGSQKEFLRFNVQKGEVIQSIKELKVGDQVLARPPQITVQPKGGTILNSEKYELTVSADGLDSTLSYQWYMNEAAISDATLKSYTFVPIDTGKYSFYCRVNGFGDHVDSNVVDVNVQAGSSNHTVTVGTTTSPSGATIKGYISDTMLQEVTSPPKAAVGNIDNVSTVQDFQILGLYTLLSTARYTTGGMSVCIKHNGTPIPADNLQVRYDGSISTFSRIESDAEDISTYWGLHKNIATALNTADGTQVSLELLIKTD